MPQTESVESTSTNGSLGAGASSAGAPMSSPISQRPQTRDAGAAMSITAARPQWPQNWTSSRRSA